MADRNDLRGEIEAKLAHAVDAESLVGLRWWPGDKMATIAFRRWASFGRRHQAKNSTDETRVNDLAKGLQSSFEPDGLHTPFCEWVHLADILANVLRRYDSTSSSEE